MASDESIIPDQTFGRQHFSAGTSGEQTLKTFWCGWAVAVCLVALGSPSGLQAQERKTPELVTVKRIWDAGEHNAFTDLVRWRDRFWCTFREAEGHVGGDGKIRVHVSADGDTWESAALIDEPEIDLRDPKFSVTPDDRLMIVAGGSVYRGGKTLLGRRPRVMFSADGKTWTKPEKVLAEGDWLWRVTWHAGICYGTSYDASQRTSAAAKEANQSEQPAAPGPADWKLKLYRSTDGVKFDLITHLDVPGYPNETTLRFLADGRMLALARREAGTKLGWIGTSKAPYADWKWHDAGMRVGGPNFMQFPGGELWAVVRKYGDKSTNTSAQTVLAEMTEESLKPVLTLPSGGDTSYAGLVLHDDLLWISYYSSHEGKSSIYLAKVRFAEK